MKKNFILAILLFEFCGFFAQAEESKDISFYLDSMLYCKMIIQENKIVIKNEEDWTETEYTKEALELSDNGYYYFTKNKDKELFIFGDDFFGFLINEKDSFAGNSKGWNEFCESKNIYYQVVRRNAPQITYSASSELREKKIRYEASNLGKLFFHQTV